MRERFAYRIQHFEVSLGTKFQPKIAILIIGTKFAQKEYFWSKKIEHHHQIQYIGISLDT